MKKILVVSFFILLFASTGWSVTINDNSAGLLDGTDVGNIDNFIAWADKDTLGNSNEDTETNWANSILPSTTTVTYYVKEEEDVPYYATDTANVFAYYLATPPVSEYFLLKNSTFWALFKNIDNMSWAVFNNSSLPSAMNIPSDEFTISHVTRFDSAQVPEPSTLLLFGAGIAGLAMYRRKRS